MCECPVPLGLDAVVRALAAQPGEEGAVIVVEGRGGASVGQRVVVEVLAPACTDRAACWPVRWVPESHSSLLPTFEGSLLAEEAGWETRLRLTGWYRPPLGLLGALFDALVGRRIAQRSVERFLHGLADRLLASAESAMDRGPWSPSTPGPDLNPNRVRADRSGDEGAIVRGGLLDDPPPLLHRDASTLS